MPAEALGRAAACSHEPPADVKKIAKAQDVLRAAVRKAIEDDIFRAVFESNDAIAARWPLY